VKFDKTKTAAGSIMYLSRLLTDKASPAGRESLPSLVVANVCIVVEDCSITHECPRVTSHLQRSAGGVPLSLLLAASCPLVQRLIYSYTCRRRWLRRLSAAMENASLPNDLWNNVTTSSPRSLYLPHIPYLALKIIYIVIGTVGVLDNLFVIIVFALFIKISDKVSTLYERLLYVIFFCGV